MAVAEDITTIDAFLSGCPEAVSEAWKRIRGELRRARRISQSALPAAATAAQHAALAREHAQQALNALGGVAGDPEKDKPE